MSFMPAQYAWMQPVLIGAVIVFIVDLIANTITFSSRVVSALVSAIIFAVIFGAIVYYGYGNLSMSISTTPSTNAPAATTPAK